MNIRKIEAFVRAVELGSLSKAAEELGYTQSGISHMMQSLEEEVGFPLMVRTSAGIKPNNEGQMLLPVIRELLSASESLEQHIARIKGVDSGRIRIACYASIAAYWLPGIIAAFRKDYPNVEVEIIEAGSRQIERMVEERQVDLCIYSGGAGRGYEWTPLKTDRMLVLVEPGHPLAKGKSVSHEQLAREQFIAPMQLYDGEVYDILSTFPVQPTTAFSACSDYAIINMVGMGLGVSILPELLVKNYSGGTAALELDPPVSRTLGMGVPQLKAVSPVTKCFMKYVEQFVAEQ
ncbi:MAG: LysR family transcriptional regulator [Oscillibacter sp.]|nr:LysR family transcriptional regulator [Oscillibacter sp.]MBQ2995657.1 LysR family transcriptional regulator [Oscillibacter sp.]